MLGVGALMLILFPLLQAGLGHRPSLPARACGAAPAPGLPTAAHPLCIQWQFCLPCSVVSRPQHLACPHIFFQVSSPPCPPPPHPPCPFPASIKYHKQYAVVLVQARQGPTPFLTCQHNLENSTGSDKQFYKCQGLAQAVSRGPMRLMSAI